MKYEERNQHFYSFVIYLCDQEIQGQRQFDKYLVLYSFVRQKDVTYCCQYHITKVNCVGMNSAEPHSHKTNLPSVTDFFHLHLTLVQYTYMNKVWILKHISKTDEILMVKTGPFLGIVFQVKRVQLDDGQEVYCMWVSRDPEEPAECVRSYANLTLASSLNSTVDQSNYSLGEVSIILTRFTKLRLLNWGMTLGRLAGINSWLSLLFKFTFAQ
jgi:hypothetical protein